jgi:hypothetical protein
MWYLANAEIKYMCYFNKFTSSHLILPSFFKNIL